MIKNFVDSNLKNLSATHKKIGVGLSIVTGLGLFYWFAFIRGIETTDNAYLKSNITMISARVTGHITQVFISDNQPVKAGDSIAKIDDRDYAARVNQAESTLAGTRAHLMTLESQKNLQAARIRQAQSSIEGAMAVLEKTQKEFTRSKKLVKDGAISEQFLDASTADQKNAKATLEKNQAELDAANSQLLVISSQLDETKAQVQNAEAALSLSKFDLEYTHIKAPVDGIIGNKSFQLGQLVRPGMALAYLIPKNDIWVEANFKETQITHVKNGQPVEILIDSYPGKTFSGKVNSVAPASGSEFSLLPPENATGNFTKIVRRVPIKILFDDSTDLTLLKPGLSVLVKVNTRRG